MLGLNQISKKIFGTHNDRVLKKINPLITQINELENKIHPLSDTELKAKTVDFKNRITNGEAIDALLPEAFAVVREAAIRVLGQRHYDVQLIGGITLHRGRIAEMKTGEGKTLVATLPSYLNGLTGKGVHIVTVNDYLAERDSEWMGQIFRFLGLNVGTIVHGLSDKQRHDAYAADITYGTNNEFGFDYLRDNMKFRLEDYVQRKLHYAIVDEVDSILIDEARTPLIISGPTEDSTDLYYKIHRKLLEQGGLINEKDYTIDEKAKSAVLTEDGVEKMEARLGVKNLFDPKNIELIHHVNQALRANVIFKNDVDYVVRDNQVMIVDEFTGRLMPGRRWSDGLHQAIEAKEGVEIENENQTLASITFQNYFRMYEKLSGMTGTADTEATEFKQIYNLDVSVIPTHKPIGRKDHADLIYKSEKSKLDAMIKDIKETQEKGQPILVGTISVEKNEQIAARLKKEGIRHNVLNAKQHNKEAETVAQAGKKGSVTVATNMAGRGTDIVLGGNPEKLTDAEVGEIRADASDEEKQQYDEKHKKALAKWTEKCEHDKKEVLDLGGLYIVGTERHESRRIDNQLRGRAGRQGDPGKTRFYLSLDDDLMRIFGGVKIQKFMEDDLPIEHRWISRAIEKAQRRVEGHNYDIRKHLLEYDDVMNMQRKVIYSWRKDVLKKANLKDMVMGMVEELAVAISQDFFPGGKLRKTEGQAILDAKELNNAILVTFQIQTQIQEKDILPFNDEGLKKLIIDIAHKAYDQKQEDLGKLPNGEPVLREIEKMILLGTIDNLWKDHLLAMDQLREGIGLRGYGQKNPLAEYKKEAFNFFETMMAMISGDVVRKVFAVQLAQEPEEEEHELDLEDFELKTKRSKKMQYNVNADGGLIGQKPAQPQMAPQVGPNGEVMAAHAPEHNNSMQLQPVKSSSEKVGRNSPCPCGSGKKYKKCHGS